MSITIRISTGPEVLHTCLHNKIAFKKMYKNKDIAFCFKMFRKKTFRNTPYWLDNSIIDNVWEQMNRHVHYFEKSRASGRFDGSRRRWTDGRVTCTRLWFCAVCACMRRCLRSWIKHQNEQWRRETWPPAYIIQQSSREVSVLARLRSVFCYCHHRNGDWRVVMTENSRLRAGRSRLCGAVQTKPPKGGMFEFILRSF